MIEIRDGFTSISAGADSTDVFEQAYTHRPEVARAPRRPTGARVTVEFRRTSSLSPTQCVTIRYDFAADGNVREVTGIPKLIRTVVRRRQAVLYYYRLSHWIAASELMEPSVKARLRAEANRPPAALEGAQRERRADG